MIDLATLDVVLALHERDFEAARVLIERRAPQDLLDLCQRQQVASYCWGLVEKGQLQDRLGGEAANGLKAAYLDQWQRSERLTRELHRIGGALTDRGVEWISFKGPYFAERFYGRIEWRAFTDLDLLVRRRDQQTAVDVLTGAGYRDRTRSHRRPRWMERFVHHVELEKDHLEVDLHHTLRAHPTLRISEDELWAERQTWALAGREIRVLPRRLSLLAQILSLHADVGLGVASLKHLLDLDRVLAETDGDLDWDDFIDRRQSERSLPITVNVLALLLTVLRCATRYPRVAELVAAHSELLVEEPDRLAWVGLITGSNLGRAKSWALRQYEQPLAASVLTWFGSLPVWALDRKGGFLSNLRQRRLSATPRSETAASPSIDWKSRDSLIASLGGRPELMESGRIRLGSLNLGCSYSDPRYLSMLSDLFRVEPLGVDEIEAAAVPPSWGHGDEILLFDAAEEELRGVLPQPVRSIVDRSLEGLVEIHRDAACALVRSRGERWQIVVPVVSEGKSEEHLLHCVMVVLYRALFHLGRMHLHAAAVEVGGRTSLFVGDKGAGKSTISLRLGLASARVLGEDHVVLRAGDEGFLVSGCDGNARFTEKTEGFFFDQPLATESQDVGGVQKKEIKLGDVVTSAPFEDFPVTRLFFSRVGEEFSIRPMNGMEALLRLLATVRERYRFVDARDRQRFLDFLGDLASSAETWELTLSDDLQDLDQLVEFLEARDLSDLRRD